MTNKPLDELDRKVAEAQGWEAKEYSNTKNLYYIDPKTSALRDDYHPSTNKAQAMELVIKYKVNVEYCIYKPNCECPGWMAVMRQGAIIEEANTPMEAICKAVIAQSEGVG